MPTASIPATLIPGDGIGPEIVDATLAALDALGVHFEWDRQVAGLEGVKSSGDPLPQATLDSIRRTRLALKGPLETPSGGGYRSSNVRLREAFKLYANLRPARTLIPGGRFDHIVRVWPSLATTAWRCARVLAAAGLSSAWAWEHGSRADSSRIGRRMAAPLVWSREGQRAGVRSANRHSRADSTSSTARMMPCSGGAATPAACRA